MSIIQWDESYSVGHKEIDKQHRKLVDMIGRLQQSLSQGLVNPQIGIALKELVQYTKYHFSEEKEVMRQIGYPECDTHLEMHERLTQQVVAILTDLKQGKPLTAVELIQFLRSWLVDHIVQEDKKIGAYIRARSESALADM